MAGRPEATPKGLAGGAELTGQAVAGVCDGAGDLLVLRMENSADSGGSYPGKVTEAAATPDYDQAISRFPV